MGVGVGVAVGIGVETRVGCGVGVVSTITVWIEGGRTMTMGVAVGGAGLGVGVGTSAVGPVVGVAGVSMVGLPWTGSSGDLLSQQAAPKKPTAMQTVSVKSRRLSTGSPPFPGTVPTAPPLFWDHTGRRVSTRGPILTNYQLYLPIIWKGLSAAHNSGRDLLQPQTSGVDRHRNAWYRTSNNVVAYLRLCRRETSNEREGAKSLRDT